MYVECVNTHTCCIVLMLCVVSVITLFVLYYVCVVMLLLLVMHVSVSCYNVLTSVCDVGMRIG